MLRSTAIQDIYIEPGAALVRDGGVFVASVVDLIDTDGRTVAVLDTSVNHMPEVFEYSDLPGIEPEVLGHRDDLPAGEGFGYVLAGSTCLAGDLFGTYRFAEPLAIGSRVVFPAMGAYSLVKAHMFNGQPLPNIYLEMRRRFCRAAPGFELHGLRQHQPSDRHFAKSRQRGGISQCELYEEQIRIPLPAQSDRLLSHIAAHLGENLPADAISSPPERAKTTLIARSASSPAWCTITRRARARLWIFPRTHESCERFTTVLVVPTGIDAEQ